MEDKIESKDYNNCKFIYSNEEVKTDPEFIVPNNIFKFYTLNERNVTALLKNQLYASHPYQLNDLCDSSDKIFDFRNMSKALFLGFYKIYLGKKFDEKEIEIFFIKDKDRNFREFRETFVSCLSNKFGSISFSNNCRSALMWSHYTSDKGFCIEFETKKIIKKNSRINPDISNHIFRPMQYVKEIELLKFKNQDYAGIRVPFLYMTTVKNKEWEYEKEFRLTIYKKDMDVPFNQRYSHLQLHKGNNHRFFNYDKSSIKSIFLGKNFFNNKFIKIGKNDTFEIEINEKSIVLENFINLLFEKYNDRIYIIDESQESNILQTGIQKIYFERTKLNIFKLILNKKIIEDL